MRENRTYGSEGGEARAFPTPIRFAAQRSAPPGVKAGGLRGMPRAGLNGWRLAARPDRPGLSQNTP